MKIQQLIDEQMKEFDERFPGDVTTMEKDGMHARITSSLYNRDSLKFFINAYTRKLIEAVGEEIIGKDQREAELGYAVVILGKEENKLRAKQRAKLKKIINSLK